MSKPTRLALSLVVVLVVAALGAECAIAHDLTSAEANAHADSTSEPAPTSHGRTANDLQPRSATFHLPNIDGAAVFPDANDLAFRSQAGGPLLLFLPATGHVPEDYRLFLHTAAGLGYHVLGLDFWNLGRTVIGTCRRSAVCFTDMQRNRLNGLAGGSFSGVNDSNSITDRLTAALAYLSHTDKSGDWSHYLLHGRIQWNRIVVAGHSQGGGEAAYIAHTRTVLGQLTFSAPILYGHNVRASWLSTPSATPVSRMYALIDTRDHLSPDIRASLTAIGIPGTPVQRMIPVPVRGSGTHELISTLGFGSAGGAHLRVVTDGTVLTSLGVPVLLPTWRWLLKRFLPTLPAPGPASAPSAQA